MGGGPESRCVGRVYGWMVQCARHHPNLTSSAPDDGRIRPKHVELRKLQYIKMLHQVGISLCFLMKIHGEITFKF